MGKLAVRIAAAVVLAVGVFWAAHATGSAAASVRRVLHTYILLDSVPTTIAAGAPTHPSSANGGALRWPLTGTIAPAAKGGITIAAPSGTLVRAASAGTVQSMPADAPGVDIVISGKGLTLVYGHVGPAYVHKGQVVREGETLGEIPHFGPGQTPAVLLQARRGGKPTSVLTLLGSP